MEPTATDPVALLKELGSKLSPPTSFAFSPDDKTITFLDFLSGQQTRALYGVTAECPEEKFLVAQPSGSGDTEENISLEEKLRRERSRSVGIGITSYSWSSVADSSLVVVPLQGSLFAKKSSSADLVPLFDKASTGASGGAIDPHISPDGTSVGFVQDSELYTVDVASGSVRQLTAGARGTGRTHGLANFIAQEEMDRYSGFWWSPCSSLLAFEEVDETHIPVYRILHQGKDAVGSSAQEDHHYPFAGGPNPRVRLGVLAVPPVDPSMEQKESAATQQPPVVWMDLQSADPETYLARVDWAAAPPAGGGTPLLFAQTENRLQTELRLLALDAATGASAELLLESFPTTWVNLHHCFRPLRTAPPGATAAASDGGEVVYFVWASERTGFLHLYLYRCVLYRGAAAATAEEGKQHGADGYDGGTSAQLRAEVECVCALTSGEWAVEKVCGVDEQRGVLYCTGTADGPLQCHLYAVPLWGSSAAAAAAGEESAVAAPRRVTRGRGMHSVTMNHSLTHFVDSLSTTAAPPSISLYTIPPAAAAAAAAAAAGQDGQAAAEAEAEAMSWAELPPVPEGAPAPPLLLQPPATAVASLFAPSELTPPQLAALQPRFVSLLPRDEGAPRLYGALYAPDPSVHGPGPYPTVVSVYGGPHAQRVRDEWRMCCDARAQALRSRGFAVFKCDNRGSARRGLAFEAAIRHNMGDLEVRDQADGVAWLVAQGVTADPAVAGAAPVGVYGWSYGGYMSLMCLARAPSVFRVGVAGAPVTHWDGYDTHYTERYMSTPQLNPAGYAAGSALAHVGALNTAAAMAGGGQRLMLVHGLIDENVHFRHTARLINALIEADKDYSLLLFPDERHLPRGVAGRAYMERKIVGFFAKHMLPQA